MRRASPCMRHGFTYGAGHTLAPVLPLTGRTTFLRHPIACLLPVQAPASTGSSTSGVPGVGWLVSLGSAWALFRGYGNINPLSIDYACRPRLRSRLTLGGLAWPRNPWSSGGGVSHSSFATHACILTRVASTAGFLRRFPRPPLHPPACGARGCIPPPLPPPHDAPLPTPTPGPTPKERTGKNGSATASAVCLSPATLSARNHLTSELLRTLSRMAASKPTSWLSLRSHILFHLAHA